MLVAGDPKELEFIMRGLLERKRARPEEQIHKAVVGHLRLRAVPGLVFFHPANGGERNKAEAAKLKAMGVRPGASDLILLHRGRFFALELKAERGTPTESQMQFVSDVNAAGGFACIATGINQALKVLETWGLIKPDAGLIRRAA